VLVGEALLGLRRRDVVVAQQLVLVLIPLKLWA